MSCRQPLSAQQQEVFDRSPCAIAGASSAYVHCNSRCSSSSSSFESSTGTLDFRLPSTIAAHDVRLGSDSSLGLSCSSISTAGLATGLGWGWDWSCLFGDSCLFSGWGQTGTAGVAESNRGHKERVLKRQHSTGAAEVVRGMDMRGQVAVVTGGSGALGREVVWALCQAGAHVVMPSLDLESTRTLAAEVVAGNPSATLSVMFCDLSSFSSIRAFAQEFLRMQLPLHLLVNAASHSPSRRAPWEPESPITATPEYSNDGYELSFAVGYLGHFLLTELLIPKIRQTAFEEGDQGRIVNVCPINLSTVRPCSTSSGCEEAAERYANARQASLSLALYAGELACRLSNEDTSRRNCPLITINACSPEGNWDRPEAVNSGWGASGCLSALSKSPSRRKHVMSVDAALPPVHLACSSQLRDTSGIYFVGTAPAFVAWSEQSLRESSHDLYESSLHMVGLALEGSPRHSVPLSP